MEGCWPILKLSYYPKTLAKVSSNSEHRSLSWKKRKGQNQRKKATKSPLQLIAQELGTPRKVESILFNSPFNYRHFFREMSEIERAIQKLLSKQCLAKTMKTNLSKTPNTGLFLIPSSTRAFSWSSQATVLRMTFEFLIRSCSFSLKMFAIEAAIEKYGINSPRDAYFSSWRRGDSVHCSRRFLPLHFSSEETVSSNRMKLPPRIVLA